ncbi:MAG: alternative ribosome rescue aminoacyl-tRNA hydrolase ArfB [bacterium]|nr:alternative ribosome rescue aminoacyl-tRNA hydrolase ArfB [bacterium]
MKVFRIPESELVFSFSRSSGAGGQNVNKVETKATVLWDFSRSRILTDEQKYGIATKLKNRISGTGKLSVSYDRERSQSQNRAHAIARLEELVGQALIVQKKRKLTKVPRGVKAKRLDYKEKHSRKKQLRRKLGY